MANDYDFSKVGKRMPYTTPEMFFERLDSSVMGEVKLRQKRMRRCIVGIISSIAAAAAIAIGIFTATGVHTEKVQPVEFQDVDNAFAALTADDQSYLLAIYENDLFINE